MAQALSFSTMMMPMAYAMLTKSADARVIRLAITTPQPLMTVGSAFILSDVTRALEAQMEWARSSTMIKTMMVFAMQMKLQAVETMAPATTTAVPRMRQNAPILNQDMTAQVLALQTSIQMVFAMVSKSLDASTKALAIMTRTPQMTMVHAHLLRQGLIVLETACLTLMKMESVINPKR
jgi:uncharacterized membrane protein